MQFIDLNVDKEVDITLEQLAKEFHNGIQNYFSSGNLSSLLDQIKNKTNSLINNIEKYEHYIKDLKSLNFEDLNNIVRDIIYRDFFELQNLLNIYFRQQIIMTYVHIDENGERTIQLYNNDIEHLSAQKVTNKYTSKENIRLVYQFEEHGKQLKRCLPNGDDKNIGLQNTAKEVTNRFYHYKGRILWKIQNEWYGYKIGNLGPINEAFTAFYIRRIEFNQQLQENIHIYMLHTKYGVIAADNANGFLMGDVKMGGLQFQVKGELAGPQGVTQVKKELILLKDSNFSYQAFDLFKQHLIEEEQKKAKSLIKPLTKKSLNGMIRYYGEKLLEPITQYQ